jgi:hypothetical protein
MMSDEEYFELKWWDDENTLINHSHDHYKVETTNLGNTCWTPHVNTPVDFRKTGGISAKVYDD